MSGPLKKRVMPLVDKELVEWGLEYQRRMNEWMRDRIIAPALARHLKMQRSKGGKKTARQRKLEAAKSDGKLAAEAIRIRRDSPRLSVRDIARRIAERNNNYGGAESIRKKLARLLRDQVQKNRVKR